MPQGIHNTDTCTADNGRPCEMCRWASCCVLHPDRAGMIGAAGIRVCGECFEAYQAERRTNQGLQNRPFYQSLVKARHLEVAQ